MAQRQEKPFQPKQEKRLLFVIGFAALLIIGLFIGIS